MNDINITCPHCGAWRRSILDLLPVRSIGLALFGTCPECGRMFGVNQYWRAKRYITHIKGD